ncbi:MAG: type II secretion system protein GspM [Betaproteobacteria bacterium]
MVMRSLDLQSPQAQRVAALALLVVALLAAAALVAIPVFKLHQHYDSALEALLFRFDKLRSVAAQKSETQKGLDAVKGENAARFFLKNSATNLAGAELQDLVRGAVERGGARLTSVQVAAPKEEGRHRQIVLNVQVIGNVMTLKNTLHAIESSLPYLFVDTLRINSTQFRGARTSPGLEPEVTVQMDVSAYAPIGAK